MSVTEIGELETEILSVQQVLYVMKLLEHLAVVYHLEHVREALFVPFAGKGDVDLTVKQDDQTTKLELGPTF